MDGEGVEREQEDLMMLFNLHPGAQFQQSQLFTVEGGKREGTNNLPVVFSQ